MYAHFLGLWGHEDHQDTIFAKSGTGFVVIFSNCPVLWVSKLKTYIDIFTIYSGYVAFSHYVGDLPPLKSLIKEVVDSLGINSKNMEFVSSSNVYEESNGSIIVATTPRMTPNSNHIGVIYHWLRQDIGDKTFIRKI